MRAAIVSTEPNARNAHAGWHVEDRQAVEGEGAMPAKSKAQQKAAGAALSAKRGDTKKSELKGASREMYESMSEDGARGVR